MRYMKALLVIVCGCAVSINNVGASHAEEGQKAAEANLISTMHWVEHIDLTLDRPLREVWPVFKDMRRWYTDYTFEDVSGPSYQTGTGLLEDQVIKVTAASNSFDATGPQYFIVKTIKVVPQKEIVVVLWGRAYDWKRYTSFYVWKMTEKAKKTTVFVDSYGEAELGKPLPKGELRKYQDKAHRLFHRSWSEAFANLKKVLDEEN